jgi:hypothetical protein
VGAGLGKREVTCAAITSSDNDFSYVILNVLRWVTQGRYTCRRHTCGCYVTVRGFGFSKHRNFSDQKIAYVLCDFLYTTLFYLSQRNT